MNDENLPEQNTKTSMIEQDLSKETESIYLQFADRSSFLKKPPSELSFLGCTPSENVEKPLFFSGESTINLPESRYTPIHCSLFEDSELFGLKEPNDLNEFLPLYSPNYDFL
mmetsp:Transcript_14841/g.15346  ORF Transcript_14841/g.15346 Transcript_14841/m.15346 type:complete len:112 (+) Transcript_14841:177-512(+)